MLQPMPRHLMPVHLVPMHPRALPVRPFALPPYSQRPPRQVPGRDGVAPRHPGAAEPARQQNAQTYQIRVSGFWPRVTKNALLQFFQSFGQVLDCRLIQDRRSGDANHAIVEFKEASVVDLLLAQPRAIKGTRLDIERVREPTRAAEQHPWEIPNANPNANPNGNANANRMYVNNPPAFVRGGPGPPRGGSTSVLRTSAGLDGNAAMLLETIKSRGGQVLMSDLPPHLSR